MEATVAAAPPFCAQSSSTALVCYQRRQPGEATIRCAQMMSTHPGASTSRAIVLRSFSILLYSPGSTDSVTAVEAYRCSAQAEKNRLKSS